MASIRKKNDKWQAQVRRKGLPAQSRTFLTKSDALKWSRAVELQFDRRDLPIDTSILDEIVLGDLVARYTREIVATKRSASVETVILNAFSRHELCRKQLSAISQKDWNDYREERLLAISPKSLKRQLSPLRHMFQTAIDDWRLPLTENPISKIRLKVTAPHRTRRISKSEEAALFKVAGQSASTYLPSVLTVALETGMRRGELLAVKFDDIDFGARTLRIPVTKNGEPRSIPLTTAALVELKERREKRSDGEDRVFSVSPDALRHAFSRACLRAKIENLHFHDLRHEAISRFFEMGLTTPEVALISGHKDIRMLFRYAHATQKAILGKFDQGVSPPVA